MFSHLKNLTTMEKYSKKELQDTVVKQQSELARYKSRLAGNIFLNKYFELRHIFCL